MGFELMMAVRPYQLAFLISFECIILTSIVLLFVNRESHAMKVRGVTLTILQALIVFCSTPGIVLQLSFWPDYPCLVIFWAFECGLQCWILVFLARGLRFYNLYKFNQFAANEYKKTSRTLKQKVSRVLRSIKSKPSMQFDENRDSVVVSTRDRNPSETNHNQVLTMDTGILQFEEGVWKYIHKSKLVDRIVNRTLLCLVLLAIGYCIIVQLTSEHISFAPTLKAGDDCRFQHWIYWPAFAAAGLFILVFTPWIIVGLRNAKDTQGIQLDVILTASVCSVCLILYFIEVTGVIPVGEFWAIFGPNHLIYLLFGVGHITSVILPITKMWMERKKQNELKINQDSFSKVLNNPTLFAALKEAAIKDLCSEQIIFLEELSNLARKYEALVAKQLKSSFSHLSLTSRTFDDMDTYSISSQTEFTSPVNAPTSNREFVIDFSEPYNDRESIYQKSFPRTKIKLDNDTSNLLKKHIVVLVDSFIIPGSPLELNLSAKTRTDIIRMVGNEGHIDIAIFDIAKEEVVEQLFFNTFPKIIKLYSRSQRN